MALPALCLRLLALLSLVCLAAGDTNVAFIYGTLPNDLSWTYAADLARYFVEFSRPSVKTTYTVVNYGCGNDTYEALRSYARGNYSLVVAVSSSFEDCALEVAREFPATYFLTLGGGKAEDNYASAFGRMYEGRWVTGVLAGLMTKTKTIGFIGAVPIYQGFTDVNAFLLGARSVCSDCKVVHYYCDGFFVPGADAYAAEVLITQHNADVIGVLQNAFDHIAVAEKYGVPVFGIDAPQNSISPSTIATSTYWVWGPMLIRYIDNIIASAWESEFTYWGFRENGIGISAMNDFAASYTSAAQEEVARMAANELVNGTSFVFCGPTWVALAPSGTPACLTQDDIIAMDYFISGVEDMGVIVVPDPPKKKPFAKWKIAVIVVCGVLGLVLIAALVVFLFQRYYNVFVISKGKQSRSGAGRGW